MKRIAATVICLILLAGCGPKNPKHRDLTGQDRSQVVYDSDSEKCGAETYAQNSEAAWQACMRRHGWDD